MSKQPSHTILDLEALMTVLGGTDGAGTKPQPVVPSGGAPKYSAEWWARVNAMYPNGPYAGR